MSRRPAGLDQFFVCCVLRWECSAWQKSSVIAIAAKHGSRACSPKRAFFELIGADGLGIGIVLRLIGRHVVFLHLTTADCRQGQGSHRNAFRKNVFGVTGDYVLLTDELARSANPTQPASTSLLAYVLLMIGARFESLAQPDRTEKQRAGANTRGFFCVLTIISRAISPAAGNDHFGSGAPD